MTSLCISSQLHRDLSLHCFGSFGSASLLSSAAERAAGEHSVACGTDPTQSWTQSEYWTWINANAAPCKQATAVICVRCINEYPGRRWRLNQSDCLVNETQNVFSELNCTHQLLSQVYEATSELLVSWLYLVLEPIIRWELSCIEFPLAGAFVPT